MKYLLLTSTILNLFLAMTMAFFYRAHKTFPGFGHWTVGGFALAVSYFMMAFRGIVHTGISIFAVNLLVPLAGVLYLDGMRRFLSLPPMWRGMYIIPVVVGILSLFTLYFFDSGPLRSFMVSFSFSMLHLYTAWLVYREYPKTKSIFYLIISVEMFCASVVLITRSVTALTSDSYRILVDSPIESAFFITVMVLQIIISLSFILLNTERFEKDLMLAQSSLESNVRQLVTALEEVKTLRGILPICANCKKIRDDSDNWVQMEVYVRDRTEADFSHGICPDCMTKLYPEYAETIVKKK